MTKIPMPHVFALPQEPSQKEVLARFQLLYLAKQVAFVRLGLRTPAAAWAAYQAYEVGMGEVGATGAREMLAQIPYEPANTDLLKHFLGLPDTPSSLAPAVKTEIERVLQEILDGDLVTKARAHLL